MRHQTHAKAAPHKVPTVTSQVVDTLRLLGPLTRAALVRLLGRGYNPVHAALHWLERCGAVRCTRGGLYRATPGRDRRVRQVAYIVAPITRARGRA